MTEQRLAGGRGSARCALALLVVLLLGTTTACSSDSPAPAPMADDTSSVSASPTTTPSPSGPPTLPPEARGTSDKAAIAFVEHVIEVLNYSAKTLDTSVLERLADPDCAACDAVIASVERIRSAGGLMKGGAWTPIETSALTGASGETRQVQAVVDCEPQVVRRSSGGNRIEHPGGRRVYIFDIERAPDGWTLTAIRGQSS